MPDASPQLVPDLRLVVNGNDYIGWYVQEFSRTMEDICGSFSLSVLHDADGSLQSFGEIVEGDRCELFLGDHLLMTGWVDASNPFYSRSDIGRKVEGRDITCDLVDSSARYQGGEWINADLARIASDLCATKGIKVQVIGDVGAPFAVFRIETGETIGATLARAASYRGMMLFTSPEGHLVITQAGSERTSTQLRRGDNIIAAERSGGAQGLFYAYRIEGQDDANAFGTEATRLSGVAYDQAIRKTREIIVPAETGVDAGSYQMRAAHTAKQRRGRAFTYTYTVEDWLQDNGRPWVINERVDVDDPVMGLDMAECMIAGVNYKADRKDGKTVVLTLKPPSAFDNLPVPEPRGDA